MRSARVLSPERRSAQIVGATPTLLPSGSRACPRSVERVGRRWRWGWLRWPAPLEGHSTTPTPNLSPQGREGRVSLPQSGRLEKRPDGANAPHSRVGEGRRHFPDWQTGRSAPHRRTARPAHGTEPRERRTARAQGDPLQRQRSLRPGFGCLRVSGRTGGLPAARGPHRPVHRNELRDDLLAERRKAEGPLTDRQLTRLVCQTEGKDGRDRRSLADVTRRFGCALTRLRASRMVEGGRTQAGQVW